MIRCMKVELQTAFRWHCEKCGEENFVAAQKAEMTDSDRESAYREFHGLEEWQDLPEGWEQFEMVCRPNTVICGVCGEHFDTVDEESA